MSQTTPAFSHGHALLIGVNQQQATNLQQYALPGVKQDVERLSHVLTHPERCAYAPDHIQVLLGEDSTRNNIRLALQDLQQRVAAAGPEAATVVIYFSGHGFRTEIGGEERFYLVPYDTDASDPDAVDATALRDVDFARYIDQVQAARVLILLDCCHAGATTAKDLSVPVKIELPPEETPRPADSKLLVIPRARSVDGSGPDIYLGSQLEALAWGTGRALLTSSRDVELSYMTEDGDMSLFTSQLINALSGHALHPADATTIGIFDVINYVAQQVPPMAAARGYEQHPTLRFEGENYPLALLIGGAGVGEGQTAPTLEETLTLIDDQPAPDGSKSISNVMNVTGNENNSFQQVENSSISISRGDNLSTGDISHSQVAMGRKAQANQVVHGGAPDLHAQFQAVHQQVASWQPAEADPAVSRSELQADAAAVEAEIAKGEAASPNRVQRLLKTFHQYAPAIFETIADIIEDPKALVADAIRGVARLMKANPPKS
jgi:hypothetical protein